MVESTNPGNITNADRFDSANAGSGVNLTKTEQSGKMADRNGQGEQTATAAEDQAIATIPVNNLSGNSNSSSSNNSTVTISQAVTTPPIQEASPAQNELENKLENEGSTLSPTISNSPEPPKQWFKRMAYTLAGIGVAGLLALALRPTPLAVDVYEVRAGLFQVTVNNEGETRVRSRYTIATPISGRLNRISLDEGDRVAADSILAQIDPTAA
jgi:hypothetical protein